MDAESSSKGDGLCDVVEEDPLLVLAGSLLRVKVNLSGTTTEEVRPEPPRPSWIQQLRDLFGRR